MRMVFVLSLAVTIGLVGLAAAPAGAAITKAGGLRYVVKSKSFALGHPTNKETLKATCPDGTLVYGGGYLHDGPYDRGYIRHSFPYDGGDRKRKPDDGWKVQIFLNNPPVTWRVYAVCAKPMRKYELKYERETVTVDEQTETAIVQCDPPLTPLSGGSRGDPDVVENESHPSIDLTVGGWRVEVFGGSFADPSELDVYAICRGPDQSYFTANGTVGADSQNDETAACPPEAPHVVGGGPWNITTSGVNIGVASSLPISFDAPGPDGWRVWLDNYDRDNTNASVSFTVFAVCIPSLN